MDVEKRPPPLDSFDQRSVHHVDNRQHNAALTNSGFTNTCSYPAGVYAATNYPPQGHHHTGQYYPYPRQGGYSTYAPPPQPAVPCVVVYEPDRKSLCEAYILAIAFGFLGAHHYYLRRQNYGIFYTFTLGLLGVGYVVDLFRLPCLVREANKRIEDPSIPEKKTLFDAYVLWFPFGLLGFHHFYLGNIKWGFAYFFTFGFVGIGFLIDLCRMPSLVRKANSEPIEPRRTPKSTCTAYALMFPPLGMLGLQHYYLGRYGFGILYTLSFGFLGCGWLLDLFRMPRLVRAVNRDIELTDENQEPKLKRLDDAYVLWFFPAGFLGFHHFYLNRPGWGALYCFTLGCLGIGWLSDLCRMPTLVRECNEKIKAKHACVTGPVNNAYVSSVTGSTVNLVCESDNFTGVVYPHTQRPEDVLPPSYGSIKEHPPTYNECVNENIKNNVER